MLLHLRVFILFELSFIFFFYDSVEQITIPIISFNSKKNKRFSDVPFN
jgi:hypothetical protein